MFTSPAMLTAPEVDESAPPDIVSPAPTVSVFVPLARVPPDRVRSPLVVSWLVRVRVPPLMESAAKEELAPILRLPVPENVTDELVPVKVVAEEVSQFPVLIVIVADANIMVAAPLEVRLVPPKERIALVRVRVPLQVRDPLNAVLIPGFTERLFTVCEMLMDPPDALTTTVEVPTVNMPRCVSIDVTVMVLPFAVKVPVLARVSVAAAITRLDAEVSRIVFPVGLGAVFWILSVPPTLSAFVASVYLTPAATLESKVTFPPNTCGGPPNVIV